MRKNFFPRNFQKFPKIFQKFSKNETTTNDVLIHSDNLNKILSQFIDQVNCQIHYCLHKTFHYTTDGKLTHYLCYSGSVSRNRSPFETSSKLDNEIRKKTSIDSIPSFLFSYQPFFCQLYPKIYSSNKHLDLGKNIFTVDFWRTKLNTWDLPFCVPNFV